MPDSTKVFHYISYLQYPIMILAAYFAMQPYIHGFDTLSESINNMMVFMGLGVSFSTLQDTTKTQNKFSAQVWQDPLKGKLFLILLSTVTILSIVLGLIGVFSVKDAILYELSFGFVILGIGLLGLLKAASEMFENHRLDKNPK